MDFPSPPIYPVHPLGSGVNIGWYGDRFPSSAPWVGMDIWLARVTLQTEVNGSLAVVLVLRPEEGPKALEGSILEFRKVGGKLTIETVFDDN
jgi:hypothetical protein